MEFVSVRDLKIKTGAVWERLAEERELVVTSKGRPIALLAGLGGNDLEALLAAVRRARGAWAARRLREAAERRGVDRLGEEAIAAEIGKARRDRAR